MSVEGKDYYQRMRVIRESINAILLPCQAHVTYVGTCYGSLSAIWYFGKAETGFASGPTPEAVAERVLRQVCGGL